MADLDYGELRVIRTMMSMANRRTVCWLIPKKKAQIKSCTFLSQFSANASKSQLARRLIKSN